MWSAFPARWHRIGAACVWQTLVLWRTGMPMAFCPYATEYWTMADAASASCTMTVGGERRLLCLSPWIISMCAGAIRGRCMIWSDFLPWISSCSMRLSRVFTVGGWRRSASCGGYPVMPLTGMALIFRLYECAVNQAIVNPVLTHACARAYPYLRPCFGIPASMLTCTCARAW